MNESRDDALDGVVYIGILRGIEPRACVDVAGALLDGGLDAVEVPLNSPQPLESIARLAATHGERALVGAGTVLDVASVDAVAAAGGRLIVAPGLDPRVVRRAKALGLACIPGIATPSEAFAALEAGADALKLFPAEAIPPPAVKALAAVLPDGARMLPVGGITPERVAAYRHAGASGFGLGSALYRPGDDPAVVRTRAAAFVAAWAAAGERASLRRELEDR